MSDYANQSVFIAKCMICNADFAKDGNGIGYLGHHSCGVKGCKTPIICVDCFKTHSQTHPRTYFNPNGYIQEVK